MNKIIPSFLLVLFFATTLAYSQDCTGYQEYHCLYADYTFFYSRQSKSALFQHGQISDLKIIAYGGEDYYIAVCAHKKFGNVHFRILEDNPGRKVIYDNADDNYINNVTFSNDVTRNLIVEVSVVGGDPKESSDRRCVGVVIEFRKTEKGKKQ